MADSSNHLKICIPSELNPPANVQLVTDEAGLQRVAEFLERETVFGYDLETNITDSFVTRRVRTIQIGNRAEQYVIDLLPFVQRAGLTLEATQGGQQLHAVYEPIFKVIGPALDSDNWLKVGQNLEFEVVTTLWCFGQYVWNLYDTLIVEKLLYAGLVGFYEHGFWALDDLIARYCALKISKEEQSSFDLVTPLTENQVLYAGLDTRWPLAVKTGQHKKITNLGLWKTVEIENNAIPAFGALQVNGINIDHEKWLALVQANAEEHRKNVKALDEFFLPVMGNKNDGPDYDLAVLEATWRALGEDGDEITALKAELAQCEDKARRVEIRETVKRLKEERKELKAKARAEFMTCRKDDTARRNDRFDKDDDGNQIDLYEGDAAINYASPDQIFEPLLKISGLTKVQIKDTNDKTLEKFKKKHAVIPALQKYRESRKTITSYGADFLKKWVNPVTGRIHSRFMQIGAETGRTSSTKPNIQNIKKEQKYRSCFTARPGYKILTLDFSGCELRIIAEMSGEQAWIDALNNDDDLHSVVAALLKAKEWKEAACKGGEQIIDDDGNPAIAEPCAFYANRKQCKCPGHKKQRKPAKNMNFGIAYGLSKFGLAAQLGITPDEAQDLIDAYKSGCPAVVAFLDKMGRHAKLHFESRTISGRRRAFKQPDFETIRASLRVKLKREPEVAEVKKQYGMMFSSIEREGKNAPIQGGNADLSKLAMGCGADKDGKAFMWHVLRKYNAKLVNMVHDEFVVEVREDLAEACYKEVGDCMSRAGAELFKRVRFTYDGHIADEWRK